MKKTKLLFLLMFFNYSVAASDIDPSGYSLYTGGKFFVLTDGVFSTEENISVRFEAAGNSDLEKYGGVDVRLYRIAKPLEFLRAQKNLHRPKVDAKFEGEGLANALSYLWDSWFKKARLSWQRIFSTKTRVAAVATVPELKQTPPHSYQTQFSHENQFKPLPGMDLVDSFRYPIWKAKSQKNSKDTVMEGSSSNFLETAAGNVILPMGKRKSGLYLVEAMIGTYRATTLAFVSDSLVVSKVSSKQALVWTVHRSTGISIPKSKVLLTDGVGVLDQGVGDADGVFISKHEIPERSFAMIEDAFGGVAVSENFFYDSEVFQPKVFMFTDRPLYQPGDTVSLRALGRALKRESSKDVWSAMKEAKATLTVLDASGVPVITKELGWNGIEGAETQFMIPPTAESGGYSLRLRLNGEDYGAAFRVARFTKPHFDAQINFDKASYKVGELMKGRVQVSYPSGEPVVGADVDLQIRSERMTVYEGSYGYNASTPVELKQKSYRSNAKGEISFSIPAAEKPSRFIVTARALDQAAYRVSTKKEILVEGFLETYLLSSDFNATEMGAPLKITFDRQGIDAADTTQKLKTWQAIRLEDRSVLFGPIPAVDRGEFVLNLSKAGHYVIRVVDSGGVTRGLRSHVVLGPDLKSASGQTEILADRENYEIGDTAKILLTFPESTEDALLTLERNDVSAFGRLGKGGNWYKSKRLSAAQWRIEVPIKESFAPNMIFSVASSRNGQFNFQNKGLVVKKPIIEVAFKPNKTVYAPREKVTFDIETTYLGKPIQAMLAVSVVDEMIYVLQPEIAPNISEFFHHIRRNQVRTSSSLSFYSFNPATSLVDKTSPTSSPRDLKLLQERARRDARDTAFWNGKLKTDANGKAQFEFTMPDALTRWRVTARAISLSGATGADGAVGESKGFINSQQNYFLKWTGPTNFRTGDKPKPTLVAFNSTHKAIDAEITLKGNEYLESQKIIMQPGANTITLEKVPASTQNIESRLTVETKSEDLLETQLNFAPFSWTETQSQTIDLEKKVKLQLPASAQNIRVKVIPNASYQFERIADDLMEYPWGCVEQTSSRLIPMVMAAKSLEQSGVGGSFLQSLRDQISSERRRLISMAGPNAIFTWWGGESAVGLLMTAHAYHADFRASKFLGIEIPKEDWSHLLKIYAESKDSNLLDQAYALWVLSYIGQPVSEQVTALLKQVVPNASPPQLKHGAENFSAILDSQIADQEISTLILGLTALKAGVPLPDPIKSRLDVLAKTEWESVVLRAASLAYNVLAKNPPSDVALAAAKILESVRFQTPTIDRSLTLAFVEDSMPELLSRKKVAQNLELGGEWKRDSRSLNTFQWKGKALPTTLPHLAGLQGEFIYESKEETKSTLDIGITRKIYRVIFKEASKDEDNSNGLSLSLVEVKVGESFDTRNLYVDELIIDPRSQKGIFMLLEVPLPPGGEVDEKTWGLDFSEHQTNFVGAKPSASGLGYSIPIQNLSEAMRVHQLLRFSSRGQFELPQAKLFKMYRPSERAFESGGTSRAIVVK